MTRARQVRWQLVVCCVAAALSACATTTTVRVEQLEPARLPVRGFDEIWIAAGELDLERAVATEAHRQLSALPSLRVRYVEPDTLEPLRRATQIPMRVAVLAIAVRQSETLRAVWRSTPMTQCGPAGCETSERPELVQVPSMRAIARLLLLDGPTARELGVVEIEERREAADFSVLGEQLAEALVERMDGLFSMHRRAVAVELREVDLPEVEGALEHVLAGRWVQAAAALEAALSSPAVRRLSAQDRARIHFDLAQVLRYDPAPPVDDTARLENARRHLRRATALDPDPAYAAALGSLERQQRAAQQLRAQSTSGGEAPAPPASYGDVR